MKEIKLSAYAKLKNRCYRTMWNKFHEGKLPNAYADDKGSIFIRLEEEKKDRCVAIYCRVSSHDQKSDLERQINRLSDFAIKNGFVVNKVYKEIASGLNDKRPELNKMLTNEKITTIIVENKDRLTRFGFNYIDTLLSRLNIEIIVASELEDYNKNDLIHDIVSIIHSFSFNLFSKQKTRKQIEDIITDLDNN